MVKDVINNVFVVTAGLESCIDDIVFSDDLIRCYPVTPDSLFSIDADKLDKVKEHNLIVVHYKHFDETLKKKLAPYFINTFNFSFPYIVYLNETPVSQDEEKKIYKEDSSICLLPGKLCPNYKTNFIYYIRSIFDRLHHVDRINSYIIDAFQTIVNAQIIEDQKNEILKLNNELSKLSKTDYLTNVYNRRAFFEILESERKRTVRGHWRVHHIEQITPKKDDLTSQDLSLFHKPQGCFFEHYGNFSCIIIDIDHFKMINDTYGHLKGDEVLKNLGLLLNSREIFRENDTVARYGGEEFVIMLPETNTFHAKIPAERLRKSVKSMLFKDDSGRPFRISISIGISEFRITDTSNEEIINRADQALYFAKENGRDQVAVYEEIIDD